MIRLYRSLVATEVVVWILAAWAGVAAGRSAEHLGRHLDLALLATLFAAAVHTLPFFFLMGSFYWLKACVDRADADPAWLDRHKLWVRSPTLPALLGAALATLMVAVSGGLLGAGRAPAGLHTAVVLATLLVHVFAACCVPAQLRRISALVSEMRAWLPPAETLAARERDPQTRALDPTLDRPGRTLFILAPQPLLLWLYLRFGTDGLRASLWPFALLSAAIAVWALRTRRRAVREHVF